MQSIELEAWRALWRNESKYTFKWVAIIQPRLSLSNIFLTLAGARGAPKEGQWKKVHGIFVLMHLESALDYAESEINKCSMQKSGAAAPAINCLSCWPLSGQIFFSATREQIMLMGAALNFHQIMICAWSFLVWCFQDIKVHIFNEGWWSDPESDVGLKLKYQF